MASRAADATIVALLVIGVIAVALLAFLYLEWLLAFIIILVAVVVIAAVVLAILGGLAVIPYYFIKRGKDTQPGSYRLEQMDDMQQKERK
ncbi:MAG: hypothetical protein MIO90_07730 [Methanomassiliicoccales archaeon]|nr:hypothetical protein [Methanomassiliicoccales archaeon]